MVDFYVPIYHTSMSEHSSSQYLSITHFLRLVLAFINDFFELCVCDILELVQYDHSQCFENLMNTHIHHITGGNENSEARSGRVEK